MNRLFIIGGGILLSAYGLRKRGFTDEDIQNMLNK